MSEQVARPVVMDYHAPQQQMVDIFKLLIELQANDATYSNVVIELCGRWYECMVDQAKVSYVKFWQTTYPVFKYLQNNTTSLSSEYSAMLAALKNYLAKSKSVDIHKVRVIYDILADLGAATDQILLTTFVGTYGLVRDILTYPDPTFEASFYLDNTKHVFDTLRLLCYVADGGMCFLAIHQKTLYTELSKHVWLWVMPYGTRSTNISKTSFALRYMVYMYTSKAFQPNKSVMRALDKWEQSHDFFNLCYLYEKSNKTEDEKLAKFEKRVFGLNPVWYHSGIQGSVSAVEALKIPVSFKTMLVGDPSIMNNLTILLGQAALYNHILESIKDRKGRLSGMGESEKKNELMENLKLLEEKNRLLAKSVANAADFLNGSLFASYILDPIDVLEKMLKLVNKFNLTFLYQKLLRRIGQELYFRGKTLGVNDGYKKDSPEHVIAESITNQAVQVLKIPETLTDQSLPQSVETSLNAIRGVRDYAVLRAYLLVLQYLITKDSSISENLGQAKNTSEVVNIIITKYPNQKSVSVEIARLLIADTQEGGEAILAIIAEIVRPQTNRSNLESLRSFARPLLAGIAQANGGDESLLSQIERLAKAKTTPPPTHLSKFEDVISAAREFTTIETTDPKQIKNYLHLVFELWNYSDKNRSSQDSDNILLEALQNPDSDLSTALINILPPSQHVHVKEIQNVLFPGEAYNRDLTSQKLRNLSTLVGSNQELSLFVAKTRRILISIARGLELSGKTRGLRAQVTQQIDKIIGSHPYKVLALIAYINLQKNDLTAFYASVVKKLGNAKNVKDLETALKWIGAAQHSVCDTSSWKNIRITSEQPKSELNEIRKLLQGVGGKKSLEYPASTSRELPDMYSEVVIRLVRIIKDNILAKNILKYPDTMQVLGPSTLDNLLIQSELLEKLKLQVSQGKTNTEIAVSWTERQNYISSKLEKAVYRAYAVGTVGWFWWDTQSLSDIEKSRAVAFGELNSLESVYDESMVTPFCGIRIASESICTTIAWSANSLVSGFEDGSFCRWTVSGLRASCRPLAKFSSPVSAAAVSTKGNIAVASTTGQLAVFKKGDNWQELIADLAALNSGVVSLQFHNNLLFGSLENGSVVMWKAINTVDQPVILLSNGEKNTAFTVAQPKWGTNELVIVVAKEDGRIFLNRGQVKIESKVENGGVVESVCLLDGGLMVTGSRAGTIQLWKMVNEQIQKLGNDMAGHSQAVRCLASSDTVVISGSEDCTAVIWKISDDSMQLVRILQHTAPIWQVGLGSDSATTVSSNKVVHTWDIKNVKKEAETFEGVVYATPPPEKTAIVPGALAGMDYDLLVSSDLLYLLRLRCVMPLLTLAAKQALLESLWWSTHLDIGTDATIISKSFEQAARRLGHDKPDQHRLYLGAIQNHYNTAPPEMRPMIAVLFQIIYRILASEEQLPDRSVETYKDHQNQINKYTAAVRDYQVYSLPWDNNVLPHASTEILCINSKIKDPTATMIKVMQNLRLQFQSSVFLMANIANLAHTFPVMATMTAQQLMLLPEQELRYIFDALAPNLRRFGSDGLGENTILKLWEKVAVAGGEKDADGSRKARFHRRDWWEPLVAYETAINNAKAVWRYMAVMLSYDLAIASSSDKTRSLQDQFRVAIGNYVRHDIKNNKGFYKLGVEHPYVNPIDMLIMTIAVLSVPSRNDFVEYYSHNAEDDDDAADAADLHKKASKKKEQEEDDLVDAEIDPEIYEDFPNDKAVTKSWMLSQNPNLEDLYMQAYNDIYPRGKSNRIETDYNSAPVFIFKDVAKVNYDLRKFMPLNPADPATISFWKEMAGKRKRSREGLDTDDLQAKKRQRTQLESSITAATAGGQNDTLEGSSDDALMGQSDDAKEQEAPVGEIDGEEDEEEDEEDMDDAVSVEDSGDEFNPAFEDGSSESSDDETSSMATDESEISNIATGMSERILYDFTFPIGNAFPVYQLVDKKLANWGRTVQERIKDVLGDDKKAGDLTALLVKAVRKEAVHRYYRLVFDFYQSREEKTISCDLHSLLIPGPFFYTGDLGNVDIKDDKPRRLIDAANILRLIADCVENNKDVYTTTREALVQYELAEMMPKWEEISSYRVSAQKAADELEASSKITVTPYIYKQILEANNIGDIYGAGMGDAVSIDLKTDALPAAEACLQVAQLMPWLTSSSHPGINYMHQNSIVDNSIPENLNYNVPTDPQVTKNIIETLRSVYDTDVWDPQNDRRMNFWQAIVSVTPPNSDTALITAAGLYLLATPIQMWTVAHSRRFDAIQQAYSLLGFEYDEKSQIKFENPYRKRLQITPEIKSQAVAALDSSSAGVVSGGNLGSPESLAAVAVETGGVVNIRGHNMTARTFLEDDWWSLLLAPTTTVIATTTSSTTPPKVVWTPTPVSWEKNSNARLNSVLAMLEPDWQQVLTTVDPSTGSKTKKVGKNLLFKLVKARIAESQLGGNL